MFRDPTGAVIDPFTAALIFAGFNALSSGAMAASNGGNFFAAAGRSLLISAATFGITKGLTAGLEALGAFGQKSSLLANIDVDYVVNGQYVGTVKDATMWGVQQVTTDAGGSVLSSRFIPDFVTTAQAPLSFKNAISAVGSAVSSALSALDGPNSYTTSDGQTYQVQTGMPPDGLGFSRFNPKSIRDGYNAARQSLANLKTEMDFTTKSLAEIQIYIKSKSPLFRELFGVNEKGAQEILNNIENVKIPEGLTKTDLRAYRELINRIGDPRGTQEFRAKILDYLIKNR